MFFFIASQSLERRSYQFIITSLRNYNRKCCNLYGDLDIEQYRNFKYKLCFTIILKHIR